MKVTLLQRATARVLGGVEWPAPRAFDSIGNDDYRTISTMTWFSRRAIILANFERLEDYAWDGQLFWGEDLSLIHI